MMPQIEREAVEQISSSDFFIIMSNQISATKFQCRKWIRLKTGKRKKKNKKNKKNTIMKQADNA